VIRKSIEMDWHQGKERRQKKKEISHESPPIKEPEQVQKSANEGVIPPLFFFGKNDSAA